MSAESDEINRIIDRVRRGESISTREEFLVRGFMSRVSEERFKRD